MRPDLLTFTRELLINPAAAEDVAGRPERWTQGELELRLSYRFEPGQRPRRRDRARAAEGAPAAAVGRVRVAGAGAALRAGGRADPVAAQGAAQAARAGPGDRGEGARAAGAAAGAAAGGAGGGDRGPARRADRGHRLGSHAAAGLSEDDLQRRGRAGARDRLRAGPERAARAGAAEAAGRAGGRDAQARAHRADVMDVRDDPEGGRAARARARPCAPTCRWSTRARPSGCGRWRAPRRSGCTCGWGCGGCWR